MKTAVLSTTLLVLFSIGCAKKEDKVETSNPSAFSIEQLNAAAQYSKENGGSGVLVMEKGEILFEDYHNGADQNTATHLHSATKLFWASVAALAKQNKLMDYEELVSKTITEWQDKQLHPQKDKIKIQHLLTLSAGLSQNLMPLSNSSNTYQHAIDALSYRNPAGSKFSYGPSNYYVFGALLERKLHANGIIKNPLEYLETEILDKIGLEYVSWSHDSSGNPNLPNGCTITPRNWVKYGQFLLQKGEWNGEQIIEPTLLDEITIPTGPNPGHGNFVWLNTLGGFGFNEADAAPSGSLGGFIYNHGYTEIYGGLGSGKNRMYLIPSLDVIIIRQTTLEEDEFDDNGFLELLLQ